MLVKAVNLKPTRLQETLCDQSAIMLKQNLCFVILKCFKLKRDSCIFHQLIHGCVVNDADQLVNVEFCPLAFVFFLLLHDVDHSPY